MAEASVLDRQLYSMSDVDRHLGLRSGTARRWIDGYRRGSRMLPPVIRPEHTGEDAVTWGEFVETRLLAGYRVRGVSLQRLRPAVVRLRAELGTDYPLAQSHPFLDVEGRELVRRVQDETGLERDLLLVVVRSDQTVMSLPVSDFTRDAVYEAGVVRALKPGTDTPDVRIDPLRQSGSPVVRSVPTAVLAEGFRAGETIEDLAELYELPELHIQQAIRFEMRNVDRAA
jgi:uncharacterized protein (DUF433 family)/transposase-like protein